MSEPGVGFAPARNFSARSVVIRGVRTRTRRLDWAAGFDPLAARLADGDPAAPRDLVERHYAERYRYALSVLRDERAAEEAVKDDLERALGALGRYREGRFRGMRLRLGV